MGAPHGPDPGGQINNAMVDNMCAKIASYNPKSEGLGFEQYTKDIFIIMRDLGLGWVKTAPRPTLESIIAMPEYSSATSQEQMSALAAAKHEYHEGVTVLYRIIRKTIVMDSATASNLFL